MNQHTQDVSGPPPPPQRGLLGWLFGGLRNPLRRRGLASSIGRYRVIRKIGEGGMGTVFEAVDEVLGRRVAIKRLKAVDESARRRFWREARAAVGGARRCRCRGGVRGHRRVGGRRPRRR